MSNLPKLHQRTWTFRSGGCVQRRSRPCELHAPQALSGSAGGQWQSALPGQQLDKEVEVSTVRDESSGGKNTSPGTPKPPLEPMEANICWKMTLLCCLGPSIGGLLFGYDIGSTSGALLSLTDPNTSGTDWYNLSPLDRGEIVSLSMVGACVASLIALIAQDKMGRRKELILAACCYGIASATMAAAPNENTLLVGRLLYGMGIGFAMHGAPAYIAETVPQRIRGLALTCKEMLIVTGILLGFVASYELSGTLEGWRWLYLLSSTAAVALGVVMLYLPESPRWSLLRGERPIVAREAIKRIRSTETRAERAAVNRELGSMYANTERLKLDAARAKEQGLVGALYKDQRYRTPLLIGCSLMLFQQITGQPSVLYYASQIFQSAGASAEEASTFSLWVGALKIVGTLVAVWKVDQWGRRPLLLGGIAGTVLTLLPCLATVNKTQRSPRLAVMLCGCQQGMTVALLGLSLGTADILESGTQTAVELSSLLLYVTCYQFSFGAGSWLICGELFPLAVRGPAMALATMTNFSSNCLVTLLLPSLQTEVGLTDIYLGFAGMAAVAFAVLYFALPETRGRSLEEIEALFTPDASAKALR